MLTQSEVLSNPKLFHNFYVTHFLFHSEGSKPFFINKDRLRKVEKVVTFSSKNRFQNTNLNMSF